MDNATTLNSIFSKIGDNLLLIWWGIVMIVHPLTIGMGAIGTGLILLGVNAARLQRANPPRNAQNRNAQRPVELFQALDGRQGIRVVVT